MTKKLFAATLIACLSAGAYAKSHDYKHYEQHERKEQHEKFKLEQREQRDRHEVRDEHKRAEEIAHHDAAPGNAHVEFHHDGANGVQFTH
ncbi:hypothetical protein AWB72_02045 [Caballeronia concitans]|uniref:Lipoprotein n=2 Tax=Caballeronia concitans TaxID=1777133 RepID=A0A658QVT0_9BURK|nr:hypothetical protein BurMR1_4499 [Burkholderia sp. MR1]SAL26527.1 hypothetical protein AWB72_02045 [Caballeronia concitans]